MSHSHHPKVHAANGLQDFIAISRYARYVPEKRRRETWTEAARATFVAALTLKPSCHAID